MRSEALAAGATDAVCATHFPQGGAGAKDLGEAVIKACNTETAQQNFKLTYDLKGDVRTRIESIVKNMYGGVAVELSEKARNKIDAYQKQGYGNLPICVAKTQYSLSHDPSLKGAPTGFTVPIRDVRMAAGAGYLYALAADIQTIPGLPTAPGYLNVDVDPETGDIEGLF